MSVREIETPHGPARAHLRPADDPRGLLVLGHGAGGGVQARDIVAAAGAALAEDFSVVLVEQPYRVAGRKSPAPAAQLDAAWTAVIEAVPGRRSARAHRRPLGRRPRRVPHRGGDRRGRRVLPRVPVHPPGRPEKSRLDELDGVSVPVLIVQGTSDPFGMPPEAPDRTVVKVPGNHSLTGDLDTLRGAVGDWLRLRA